MWRYVQPPQRGKYGQSGVMRSLDGSITSSTLAKATLLSVFKMSTQHFSPRSAPWTNTTRPSMRATPMPPSP